MSTRGNQILARGRPALAFAAVVAGGVPGVACAQDGLIVQPSIPQGFDRDRNVSVQARPRPSYTPTGIHVGGLMFFPQLETSAGVTSNAYLTQQNEVEAPYASLEPSLRVSSIWSRHSLQLNASALLRNYIGESRRNERQWNLGARSEVELGRALTVTGEASASQSFENQFSGEVASNVAALSRFRRDFVSLRGEYTSGRVRTFLLADYADFRFAPVRLNDGAFRSQENRNRNVTRITGQFEYARTPSVSLFGQLGYTGTTFDGRIADAGALNSDAARAIGGLNVDLAGRARGTISLGYSIRDYRRSGFDTVGGLIAEARVELFPTERFTITAGARRTVEDATFGNLTPRPFWDNRVSLGGDYELLNNLILSAEGQYALQTYFSEDRKNSTYRLATRARYLISRRMTLEGSLSYSDRDSRGVQAGNDAGEGRLEAGLTYHM
ncbi:outer membrane beta-barrel protein [Sphingomonas sp. IC4-52]|uniref:outer membrane beta-barrel protein n=1 Tax=Sphingomonas sp. IC4-52 TaxID=2887202 RepID=UPI001D11C298|nr:outer membrane beta-barrel protein [Sphingomonas sp. IC4-52]MCC2980154.1 outer membrane beta-barrel protein [Sphingomonas sp. IC4-52]